MAGGARGIRTPGGVTLNGFQDRRIQPLCHRSGKIMKQPRHGCGGDGGEKKTPRSLRSRGHYFVGGLLYDEPLTSLGSRPVLYKDRISVREGVVKAGRFRDTVEGIF